MDLKPVYKPYALPKKQTERYVQTVKKLMKMSILDQTDIDIALLNYRNTALEGFGASPAQPLISRK